MKLTETSPTETAVLEVHPYHALPYSINWSIFVYGPIRLECSIKIAQNCQNPMRSELRCKVFHLNGVQTSLECKVNVKQMSRFVFPAGSLFYRCNVFIYKAINSFSFNQVFTRFVFPPLLAICPNAAKLDFR